MSEVAANNPDKVSDVSFKARLIGAATTGALLTYLGYPFDKYKNAVMMKAAEGKLSPVFPKEPIFNFQKFSVNTKPVTQVPVLNTKELVTRFQTLKEKIAINTIDPNYKNLPNLREAHRAIYKGVAGYGFYKFTNTMLNLGAMIPLMEAIQNSPVYKNVTSFMKKDDATLLASALSGGCLGMIETAGLPIDRAKQQCQLKNISMRESLWLSYQQGLKGQYAGLKETALRNIAGSGGLALGEFATYRAMGVTDYNKSSPYQIFAASLVANFARVLFSHPFDFIKNHKQKYPDLKDGVLKQFYTICKEQGVSAFKQGAIPKLISAAKGTFFQFFCRAGVLALDRYMKQQEELKGLKSHKLAG